MSDHIGLLKSESIMTGLYQNVPAQPAVQASMAIPGVFTSVELDGRVSPDPEISQGG